MQKSSTFLLRGGLDLVTPPVALQPGTAIAAVNYEPDIGGYRRMRGYERFNGSPSPSDGADAADIAARRAAIDAIPGTGPILGVWIYDGAVYAFRDQQGHFCNMFKSTPTGWSQVRQCVVVHFQSGTAAFLEDETIAGSSSGETGRIARVVLRSGSWAGGDAAGYLVIRGTQSGGTPNYAFTDGETITSASGSATLTGQNETSLQAGTFTFSNFNFLGPAKKPRMYFANGENTAMEWDGTTLAPIMTGTDAGPLDDVGYVEVRGGGNVKLRDSGKVILRFDFDRPTHVASFSNHLFLGFRNGYVVHSGVGEPLDFRTAAGAGSFSFSDEITGLLPAAQTAFVIFGRNRIEYLTGTDVDTFVRKELNDASGAYAYSVQMLDEPFYLDDAGLRRMSTTDAFGDWTLGTVTRPIEPLIRAKREAGVRPAASVKVKNSDQYRLFWDDGTGIITYFGREYAETMPIKLPITVTCACVGEVSTADGGERIFVGADDGYVYELDKGTSFDGASIPAYVRLVWNTLGAPSQYKKFGRAALEIDAPEDVTLGFAYHVDFSRRSDGSGAQVNHSVSAGSRSDWAIDDYANIDWTVADQGQLETWVDTIGRNLAISVISESSTEASHTLSSMTLNYAPRRAER